MNVTQLRTFIVVVERGSFSEAARTLGVSQPAVTMQIQSLESDVGVTLLDRGYRRVDLTEAGSVLLPHAHRVLEQIDEAHEEIAALSGTVSGHLRIAASTTPGDYVVPGLLGAFVTSYPQVRLSIKVEDTAAVIGLVESGEIDVGITGAMARGARVEFQELPGDELVLVCAPGHRLASVKTVKLSSLAEETWVTREAGSGTHRIATEVLKAHGLDVDELRVAVELGTGESVISAVEGGLGIAVVSRLVAARSLRLGTLAEVDAPGLPFVRPFYVVLPKRTPTRAAEAFSGLLAEQLAR